MEHSLEYFFHQTTVAESFKQHFEDAVNTRILFSGKFGTGKSTFLNQFFKDESSKYIVFNISPINYSVATNEDVFELIKYDLFSELLAKYADKLDFVDNDFSPLLLAQSYALNDLKIYPFVKALLKTSIPKGKEIVEVVKAAKEIYDNFKAYEQKTKLNEGELIKDYIKWCENRKGSIYEYDEITALITELIHRVKVACNNIPVTLIVDDLDRLDPEHVFRLFNIFSAHYDVKTTLNKFDLDKVIFVCDYQNIQKMYVNKYGVGVDFDGYIDKFYSTKVFEFDNRKHLTEELESFFDSRKQYIPEGLLNIKRYTPFNRENLFYKSLVSIFTMLIGHGHLTIRNLERFKRFDLPSRTIKIGDTEFPANFFYFLTFIHLLLKSIDQNQLYTTFQFLEDQNIGFSTSSKSRYEHPEFTFLVNSALLIVIGDNLVYSNEQIIEIEIGNKKFPLNLEFGFDTRINYPRFQANVEYEFNVFSLIKSAFQKCLTKGYLD
jgi:hypothetical protein